jgi:RND family efflux transporter MFP subunit
MSKKSWMVLLFVLVLAVIGVLHFTGKSAQADVNPDSLLQPAAVALVKRAAITNSLTISGAFRPYQQVDVHAKVAGYVREIYVDVGDHVKASQVLAVLEVPELNAQVAGAKADIHRYQDAVRRSQSEIQRTQSTHAAYHSAYTRLKQASDARPGLIAEQELDDSMAKDKETEAQTESSRAALSEAQSQLLSAQADLDRLSALEGYSRITAPFSGVVTKRYADTGALIQAGTASETQSMPVVQLAEWSRLRLVVPVPESAVPRLRLGDVVRVHVSAMNRDFDGKVARFADALDDETRTMHTEIDVENPGGVLKEGMYADAKIVLEQHDDALTVPVQALDRNNSRTTVLTVDTQGRVEPREIKLGVEGSDRVEVLSGLSENDCVIVGDQGAFHAGEKVRPRVVSDNQEGEGS